MGTQKDKSGNEVMTVAELIAALQTMPPTAFVSIDDCNYCGGCNYCGERSAVDGVKEENDYVLITKSN